MTTAAETRNWLELPLDVTASILSRIGAIEILNSAQNVCSLWRNICKDPLMWRSIDMHNLGDLWDMDYDLAKMCVHAVDRSCGHLLDINVEYFGTDALLLHISESTKMVTQLFATAITYHCPCFILQMMLFADEGLSEAALKLPFLEELEISYCSISKDALETIGRSCPLLKSFKFNVQGCRRFHLESDDEALAIAQTMPELRHLQLFGNKLTNDGLLAILNGCPHLEYLDLRQCFNVSLGGNLEKRCVERIKNLRRPNDSTLDYEFYTEVHDTGSSDEDYPSGISDIDFMMKMKMGELLQIQ
ncbi:hypothetical protein GOBAR_DD27860 [Gossypium barbadense]|nr:hypothetical protein GOBAR_DD27860 [Gossypium barbadense]